MADNEYLGLAKEFAGQQEQPAPVSGAQAGMYAAGVEPVRGESVEIARELNLPVGTVERNFDELSKVAKRRRIDFGKLATDAPLTNGWLADPVNASVAGDDIDNLVGIEQAWDYLKKGASALGSGLPKFNEGVYGAAQMATDTARTYVTEPLSKPISTGLFDLQVLPEDPLAPVSDFFSELRQGQKGLAESMMPKADGAVEAGVYSGLQSFGQNALTLPAAIMSGNPGFALAPMVGGVAGQEYGRARDKGVDYSTAALYATSQAAVEGATELIPAIRLVGDLEKKTGFMSMFARQLAAELPGEQVATLLQDLNEWAVLNPDKSMKSFTDNYWNWDKRLDAALQTAVATVVGTGGMVTTAKAIDLAAKRFDGRANKAAKAMEARKAFERMNKAVEQVTVKNVSPSTMQAFADHVAQGGSVYVDANQLANALQQSGIDINQAMADIPSIGEQFQQKVAAGQHIKIPAGEFLTKVAGTNYAQAMLDHLKTDPNDWSQAEADEVVKGNNEAAKAEVERIIKVQRDRDAHEASADVVRKNFEDQLNAADRFSKDVNKAKAQLLASFFSVMAARLGITPEQMADMYQLQVKAENVGQAANTLKQDIEAAPEGSYVSWVINNDPVFDEEGNETAGEDYALIEKIFVPKESRGRGAGRALLRNALREITAAHPGMDIKLAALPFDDGMDMEDLVSFYESEGFDVDNTDGDAVVMKFDGRIRGNTLNQSPQTLPDTIDIDGQQPAVNTLNQLEAIKDDNGDAVEFYHGGDGVFSGIDDSGRFGGAIFVRQGKPSGYGKHQQVLHLKEGAILELDQLASELNSDTGRAILSDAIRTSDDDVVDAVAKALTDGGHYPDDPGVWDAIGAIDEADAQVEIQTLRGKLARALGFGAVRTPDEFDGETVMVLDNSAIIMPGSTLNQSPQTLPDTIDIDGQQRPTRNSNGQPIAQTERGIRNFYKWFGDSKVVDEQGRPLVVYHGTDADFNVFQPSVDGVYGPGAYMTKYNGDAATYGSKVMHVYGSLQNPYVATPTEARRAKRDGGTKAWSNSLLEKGYDGIILDDMSVVVAFRPEQIKSAVGNSGEFDPQNPNILKQDAKSPRAQISFADDITSTPTVITLLKGANLSSFIHESGHFFLEVLADISSRPNAPLVLIDDFKTVMDWFGVTREQWATMTLEEKRPYHEQFARGFEVYAWEGKAPSLALAKLFQRFRAWMLDAYKKLLDAFNNKDLGTALDVKLSNEVRSVMDRMLATQEHIYEANAARGYMPAFATKEEAEAAGVDWEEYRANIEQADQDAITALESRSLRDMQWFRNAHNKEVRRLRREAAGLRREARIAARAEVLSHPVYRVMQFLTAPVDALKAKKTKGDPNVVDPATDTLLVAVAKLGGMQRDMAVDQFGLDPGDFKKTPVFGKPILRRNGGMTPDGMAEALAQLGYMPSKFGESWDMNDLGDFLHDEGKGIPHYSATFDYRALEDKTGGMQDLEANPFAGGRIDRESMVREYGGSTEEFPWENLGAMMSNDGIHPDVIADQFGFQSGDEMIRWLLEAKDMVSAIEDRTDQIMLERHGDLTSKEAIEKAADEAIHNRMRAKVLATEANALTKTLGARGVTAKAARIFAERILAGMRIIDIKPAHFAAEEAKAAARFERALKKGNSTKTENQKVNVNDMALEKRNQLVNNIATRLAYDAVSEVDKNRNYLKKFDKDAVRKKIGADYMDQIDAILDRFDIKKNVSLKALDERATLQAFIESQEALGLDPGIDPKIADERYRKNYREMTLEEFRGMIDSIKQIEHLGRLSQKLLTAEKNAEIAQAIEEMTTSIREHASGKKRDLRTRRNVVTKNAIELGNQFLAMHRKMASVARELDGFKDGGPMWQYFIRSMNEAGDREAVMREQATMRLDDLTKEIVKGGKMGGMGRHFPSLGKSYNREERIAIALNVGNQSNLQRLLDGEGDPDNDIPPWTREKIQPVLDSLSKEEWDFVQSVWDFFESYRPLIAEKERRVYGKEPKWIDATPVQTRFGEYRGGYYPIRFDPRRSKKAEMYSDADAAKQMLKGAYTSSTTRRSFTKSRATRVVGRPLLYSFDGLYQGIQEVIHDLSWHEWLIDVNRLLKNPKLDKAIRENYGDETVKVFTAAVQDIATGDAPATNIFERAINHLRTGATVAGLGLNVMTSLLQPLGLTQSMVRVGPGWVAKGISQWLKSPVDKVDEIHSKSDFMRLRAKTFQREINEIQNRVSGGKSKAKTMLDASYFILIQKMQMVADVPTWIGAYEKAMSEVVDEKRAIQLADQAVRDSQGGGQVGDLSQIQRGSPLQKLFTNFYSFFNVAYNLGVERTKATNFKDPKQVAALAVDYLLLYSLPAVLGMFLKEALRGGDDDDDQSLAQKLVAEHISYLFGMMVGLREVTAFAQRALGVQQFHGSYGGPAGLRFFTEIEKLGAQVDQGDADMAAFKALTNTAGILFHLPSGQINRTVEGTIAIMDDKSDNPLAPLVGAPQK